MSGLSPATPSQPDGSNGFIRTVQTLSTICGVFSALAIITAVIITCQMIFIRFVLNGSTTWQTEAVIYLAISATLIGLPYVQRHRGHVNVDLLPLLLPSRFRKALAVLVLLASVVVIGVMLFYGYEQWHIAFERGWRSDTVWGVRLWIPYLALPIGFGMFLLQLIADLVAVVLNYETPFGLTETE